MATTTTTAQFSTAGLNWISPPSPRTSWQLKSKGKQEAFRVRCALPPQKRRESRRLVSLSLLFLHPFFSIPTKHAVAASIFDKYMKRKKLDPLETYIPAVILTQMQIKELGKSLEVDQPKYADCRGLLRYGPAASLRVNIRAVAQYASDGGNGETAQSNVDQCIRALEELDSLLLNASRNGPGASIESMKANIGIALGAMDSLLKTIPADMLNKGKAIADAYSSTPEGVEPENLDPELKQLESIL